MPTPWLSLAKKYILKKLALLTSTLFFASCMTAPTVKGPNFTYQRQSSINHSTLYVYRPEDWLYNCCWPNLRINKEPVANVINGSYTQLYIAPGKYNISYIYQRGTIENPKIESKDYGKEKEFIFEAGNEYFLRFDILRGRDSNLGLANPDPGWNTTPLYSHIVVLGMKFEIVPKKLALKEMRQTKYIEPLIKVVDIKN